MSHTANLDIQVLLCNESYISILQFLIGGGWKPNDYGFITYLPLGDDGEFEWQKEDLCKFAQIKNIINKKGYLKETIGIVLTWKCSRIGGEFLFYPDGLVSMNLSINRQVLSNLSNISDVNWYLNKIIPILNKEGYKVESIRYQEHI